MLKLYDRRNPVIEVKAIAQIPSKRSLTRYQSVPVSLADAESVRMAELYSNSSVFTLDSYFQIYRKNRDHLIPLINPQSGVGE